ncbi:UBP-type zinc finger domain-containing protein [Pedobacter hartonius]|uniref:Ubiquitin-hydrolase Zn-finger-containing protein n=1 Tax=Pedobacter hartonius TaxID=425514 RepID=A0A1H3W7L3_9SPHI|nr:UBP-type zinc finger domain-containing protein [Pedobacter hartonius]SDZ83067.1 ubiquitin-hydrolase Zn-finger-containing protein [Pedobacter hartonius]
MSDQSLCTHLNAIETVKVSDEYVCEECIKSGSNWVHLRSCQTCGVTLCCDESPQKHMTKHFKQRHHPVVASAQAGERWLWCYVDEQFIEY